MSASTSSAILLPRPFVRCLTQLLSCLQSLSWPVAHTSTPAHQHTQDRLSATELDATAPSKYWHSHLQVAGQVCIDERQHQLRDPAAQALCALLDQLLSRLDLFLAGQEHQHITCRLADVDFEDCRDSSINIIGLGGFAV